jgi:hypothetical protein
MAEKQERPRIINTLDQQNCAGGRRIVLYRQLASYGRVNVTPAWQVALYENGENIGTDRTAAWYDNGYKTFRIPSRGEAKETLLKAIAWANEKYGKREFVRNKFGDYVEKEVNDRFPIPKKLKDL